LNGATAAFFVILCTAFCVLILPSDHSAAVSSVFLVVIIVATVQGGLASGFVAALASFLLVNYFFIPPLQEIELYQAADWVTAVSFLSVVVVVHQLVRRARSEATEARRREYVAKLVAALAQAVGFNDVLPDLLDAVARWVCENLPAMGCAVFLSPDGKVPKVGARYGFVAEAADDYLGDATTAIETRSSVRTVSDSLAVCSFPILAGDRAVGAIMVVTASPLPWILAEEQFWYTVTRQVAVAIERARLQADANEAEVLLRSDELKSTLLSLVGHELQTPLTVIKTASTGLRESWEQHDGRSLETLTGVIDRETDRLHHLLRNLLDLSRIEGGALRLTLDWYDFGELLRETIDRLRPVLGTQTVQIVVDENAPPVVRVDYLLMDRVIANLILNAVRYAPSDAPIQIQVITGASWICMRVADHGPGVPEPELHRIFERFYRRDGPYAGAGLGLALCKRIVEAHSGHIWAEAPDDGSPGLVIVVTLPVSLPDGEPAVLRGLELSAVG
jgi:two-component system sensor histidine kinase KdpD